MRDIRRWRAGFLGSRGETMSVILITGASTGIGLATAVTLGRAGHHVQATMRTPARSPKLAEIAAKERLSIAIYAMDVDDDASVKKTVSEVLKQRVRIDVLVNNAGVGMIDRKSTRLNSSHRCIS